jgi:prepilin peptidase dependent protein B
MHLKYQNGTSLIEIMVALAIGMLLLGGIATFFISNLQSQKETIKSIILTREVHAISDLMAREIRRSGFTPDGTAPSTQVSTAQIKNDSGSATVYTGKCLLVAYYNNAATATIQPSGFRLIDKGGVGVVQFRTDITGGCSDTDTSNKWTNLSDPQNINITKFEFTHNTSKAGSINITIASQLKADASSKMKDNVFTAFIPNINSVSAL